MRTDSLSQTSLCATAIVRFAAMWVMPLLTHAATRTAYDCEETAEATSLISLFVVNTIFSTFGITPPSSSSTSPSTRDITLTSGDSNATEENPARERRGTAKAKKKFLDKIPSLSDAFYEDFGVWNGDHKQKWRGI
jgi:hypothetical protein